MKVPWSFEVHRGDRCSLIAATRSSDLLVVETATRPFARYVKLRTNWSEISLHSERACLLSSTSVNRQKGTLVVYDGTEAGKRAMAAAIALGGTVGALTIVAPAAASKGTDVQKEFRVAGVEADLQRIERLDSTQLRRVIAHANCDLVVLPALLAFEHRPALRELLVTPPCAILLAR